LRRLKSLAGRSLAGEKRFRKLARATELE
jgi:hypothetical protein